MARRLALMLVCGLLTVAGLACAPPRVGPTAGAGYVLTLQVVDPIIWLGPVDTAVVGQFPQVTAVLVQVQDAQPVKAAADLPLTFFQVRRVSLTGVEKPLAELVPLLGHLRFAELDRLDWVAEELTAMQSRWLDDDPEREPWRKLRGLGGLNRRELAIVREHRLVPGGT